jgi:hypothetical protein
MQSLGISRQPHLVSCYQQVYRFPLDPSGMEFKRMTVIEFDICVCTVGIFRRRQKGVFQGPVQRQEPLAFQEPCVLYIGQAYRYPPDVALYIYIFNKYKY